MSVTVPVELLVVTRRLLAGGTERHLLDLLPRLDQRSVRVTLYTMEANERWDTLMRATGVKLLTGPTGANVALRASRCAAAVARLLRSAPRPDVIHFFLPEPYVVAGPVSLMVPGVRRVMSRRSLNRYQRAHPVAARIERWLHGQMDAVIGNSGAVLDELVAEGAPPDRCARIHNGVDLARLKPRRQRQQVRSELGLEESDFVMVVVANLIPCKGHADMLQACARANSALPTSWRLLCVGRDDASSQSLRAQAKTLGLAERVSWLGERGDVPDLLCAADLAVHPSHEEGFPNAVLEAMSAGLAVIATDVGGCRDAVVEGETGLLVAARDTAAMAEAMVALASDAARRAHMGAAAVQRIRERFTLDAAVADYERLYAGLLEHRDTPVAAWLAPHTRNTAAQPQREPG